MTDTQPIIMTVADLKKILSKLDQDLEIRCWENGTLRPINHGTMMHVVKQTDADADTGASLIPDQVIYVIR